MEQNICADICQLAKKGSRAPINRPIPWAQRLLWEMCRSNRRGRSVDAAGARANYWELKTKPLRDPLPGSDADQGLGAQRIKGSGQNCTRLIIRRRTDDQAS